MKHFEEKQRFTQWWLHLLITLPVLALALYLCIQWYAYERFVDKVGPNEYGMQLFIILLLLVPPFLIFAFKLHTSIDERGIHYQFVPFHLSRKTIRWGAMEKCYVRKYSPIKEYGGWGFRSSLGKKGRAYNVKGNKGIQIEFKTGEKLLIGTQKEREATQIINKYFNKRS